MNRNAPSRAVLVSSAHPSRVSLTATSGIGSSTWNCPVGPRSTCFSVPDTCTAGLAGGPQLPAVAQIVGGLVDRPRPRADVGRHERPAFGLPGVHHVVAVNLEAVAAVAAAAARRDLDRRLVAGISSEPFDDCQGDLDTKPERRRFAGFPRLGRVAPPSRARDRRRRRPPSRRPRTAARPACRSTRPRRAARRRARATPGGVCLPPSPWSAPRSGSVTGPF